MHYIYGSNRLAIKSIFKDKDIEQEMLKFKGSFEPHLYIPKNISDIEDNIHSGKLNITVIRNTAINMIIACNITYHNLLIFGHYKLEMIDPMKVKDDINMTLFKPIYSIYGNGTNNLELVKLKEFCDKFNMNFLNYYFMSVDLLNKNMDGNIPNEIIRRRFTKGYFYKVRKRRQEREKVLKTGEPSKRTDWSWLNDKNSEEIAREIIRRDMHHTRKLELAFQKRHISITAVKNEIIRINEEDKEFIIDCAIMRWFETMNDNKRNDFITAWKQVTSKQMTTDTFRLMTINAYGYKEEWFKYYNCVNLKPIQSTLEGLSAHD